MTRIERWDGCGLDMACSGGVGIGVLDIVRM